MPDRLDMVLLQVPDWVTSAPSPPTSPCREVCCTAMPTDRDTSWHNHLA